jgi:flagellar hook-basal body complex protein FliE
MIENVPRPQLGLPPGVDPAAPVLPDVGAPRTPAVPDSGFKTELARLLSEVSEVQKSSGEAAQAVVRGEPIELHEVLIRQEEARVAFSLLLETRNRLVEAYQEIMRMQI